MVFRKLTAHHKALVIMRFCAVFAVVFAVVFGIELALAQGADDSPAIIDLTITAHESNTAYAYATNSQPGSASITVKGEPLWLDSVITWGDYSENRNDDRVKWTVDDYSIATIREGSGYLVPLADGTVTVTATVNQDTADGEPLVARVVVTITGQTDARYVTGITVIDESGNTADPTFIIDADENTRREMQFYALVDVYDPTTDTTQTYNTKNGLLSSQASDLADLTWSLTYSGNDDYIEDTTGLFRAGGTDSKNEVVASTYGGKSNAYVTGTAMVSVTGGAQSEEGYHPQDTLTIEVYYDDVYDEDTNQRKLFKSITYTVSDLEAMGTETVTYTMPDIANNKGASKNTGYGVNFSTLLKYAEVDIDSVKEFYFGTWDNITYSVSSTYLFDTTRYYLPNADTEEIKYVGAEQVYPMIAIQDTGWIPVSDTSRGGAGPWYEWRENDRFHLLSGTDMNGNNSGTTQVKWINTIKCIMEGSPAADVLEPDDPDEEHKETTPDGTNTKTQGSSIEGSGSGSGGEGTGSGGGGSLGMVGGDTLGSAGDGVGAQGEAGGSAARPWRVYEMMSKDSTVLDILSDDNPLAPFVLPFAIAVVVAGGLEALLWWSRQLAPVGGIAQVSGTAST